MVVKGFLGLFPKSFGESCKKRSAGRRKMPEDMLISMLREHFSSSHRRGTSVSVHIAGETEALGRDNLLTVTHMNSWRAGKAAASGTAGSSGRHGEWGTAPRFRILLCDQQTLGCGWKRSACGTCSPQDSTLLKIMLKDFAALCNQQSSKAQLHPNYFHHRTNRGRHNVIFQKVLGFTLFFNIA